MQQQLSALAQQCETAINNAQTQTELREIEIQYFGKKGSLTHIAKSVATLPKEQRPEMGKQINIQKKKLQNHITEKYQILLDQYYNNLQHSEYLDITTPAYTTKNIGKRHPISAFIDEVVDTFSKLGFSLSQGAEIEPQWYNFTALNLDGDHPAREMQDTFFIKNLQDSSLSSVEDPRDKGYVLRTHTSPVQIRYMQNHQPPIAIIVPGKVYRKDSDATHSPMFHQFEGLYINKNVSMGNLKYILLQGIKQLLNDDNIEMRLRLSYFPFTEPSLEIDIRSPDIKGGNWLEIGGAGMIHPQVLKNGGVDPTQYNGFAFGMGIERLIMLKYKVNDLRLFYENDIRFLEQF